MPPELVLAIFYLTREAGSARSFLAHAGQIDIVIPTWYTADAYGVVSGSPDQGVLEGARKHGVKVMPIVVNPDFHQPTVHQMLTSPEARDRVARSLLEECRKHQYYGIQFDFEQIPAKDRFALNALVRDTAALFGKEGFRLSIATMYQTTSDRPPPADNAGHHAWLWDNWLGAYDLAEIARHVEFVSVMSYDHHTERTPPGPIAGYPWVEQVLDHCLKLIPKEKFSLGIPLYGRLWRAGLARGEGDVVTSTLQHHGAMELATAVGATPVWDERERAPWFWFYRDGLRQYVFFNDARSFGERHALARSRGLHSFSSWVLGAEDPAIWKLLPRTSTVR
jgi:spore germination protein YaaH